MLKRKGRDKRREEGREGKKKGRQSKVKARDEEEKQLTEIEKEGFASICKHQINTCNPRKQCNSNNVPVFVITNWKVTPIQHNVNEEYIAKGKNI